ncbi:MAG: FHA domain-containing protein [Planctomycetes bacterium]|nr:FHA domain-containing protein [Planctomycetota bacterium]
MSVALPDAPDPADGLAAPAAGPPVGLELRFERGRRRGEALALVAGALRVGTARTNELQVREAGVSFRHAVLHVAPDGAVTLEELGARGGTFVNGAPVQGRRDLVAGDRVRLGDEVELVLAEAAARDPREALAVLVPHAVARELPEVDDLRLAAATSDALDEALAAAHDPGAREAIEADARRFADDVRGLLRPALVPAAPDAWLRWAAPDPLGCLAAPGDVYVLVRRWELLALLPDVAVGDGPTRVGGALGWLLQGAARLTPRRVDDLGGGVWACEYEAERPMLGRFSRLRAVGDGRALALAGTPAVVPALPPPRAAEDPVEEALRRAHDTNRWRPPPRGAGPAAPPLPPGGRYGRLRHRPERAK